MWPLSASCHKALLPVGGTTILGRIMDSLVKAGISRVTVVTGYRAHDVERFLRCDYPDADLRFVHSPRFAETNNVVSLSLALEELALDADVVLIECDLLFDPTLIARLIDNPGRDVALVDRYRSGMDGTVVTVRDGFVAEVYPTEAQGADFDYRDKFKTLNIYQFSREFIQTTLRAWLRAYATMVDSSCYYELVLGMLTNIPAHRISAEIVTGERWVEVDSPSDLTVASFQFEPEQRPAILDRAFGGHWNYDVLDFAFMRNAYFPTGAMLAAMRHALPELVADYGSAQPVLNEKLSLFLRCDPSRLQVLHGATQAFPILGRILDGASAAVPTPTFGEYTRAFPCAAAYPDAPGVDWAALRRLSRDCRLLVIVNPNNPTGTTLSSTQVHAFAQRRPGNMVLVDESFLAFSGEPSLVDLLERQPLDNVIVLTSLSKCLGTSGLRLGYVYSCNQALIEQVGAELPVWNLSAPAEFLLELLVKFTSAYAASIERTVRDREEFRRQLELLPMREVYPSGGNFLLARLAGDDPLLADRVRRWLLRSERIEVKDVTGRFLSRTPSLRLAVRAPADNTRLITALESILSTEAT